MLSSIRALFLGAVAFAAPTCVWAQSEAPALQPATHEQIAEADNFAISDAILTMFHEAGHMLIGEFDLPVLGREEDAADAIATIILLNQEDEDQELAIAYLEDAIEGWLRRDRSAWANSSYIEMINDDHSTNAQRGYQIACQMVGHDPTGFARIAERYELDEERVEFCAFYYERTEKSWLRVLAPHVRSENDVSGGRISVVYEPTEKFGYFAELVRSAHVLEDLAETLEESFIFPRDMQIIGKQCDWANAYYDPETGDMVLCYDLVAYERALYLSAVFETAVPVAN